MPLFDLETHREVTKIPYERDLGTSVRGGTSARKSLLSQIPDDLCADRSHSWGRGWGLKKTLRSNRGDGIRASPRSPAQ